MKSLLLIVDKFKVVMGLDMVIVGSSFIEWVVCECMVVLGIVDDGYYLVWLQGLVVELQVLIELVVVLEIWFFCDCEVIFVVVWFVWEWLFLQFDVLVCILSLLCFIGEELYLVVMVLLEVGVMLLQFVIDVYDICICLLEIVVVGVYGCNFFWGQVLGFWDCYFMMVEQGW